MLIFARSAAHEWVRVLKMNELIDRQSALSVCKEYGWIDDECFIDGYNAAIKDIRAAIKKLPAVKTEQQCGKWVETKHIPVGDTMYCDCKCSSCNFQITREEGQYPKFCENCGADMRGGADNE